MNRTVTILRSFYRAIVAMGHLEPQRNPMTGFPEVKAAAQAPRDTRHRGAHPTLSAARRDSIVGIRDRSIVVLLYGTGIRASECASLREGRVDLRALTIAVRGKGGHERTLLLNEEVAAYLREYIQVRGPQLPTARTIGSPDLDGAKPRFRNLIARSETRMPQGYDGTYSSAGGQELHPSDV